MPVRLHKLAFEQAKTGSSSVPRSRAADSSRGMPSIRSHPIKRPNTKSLYDQFLGSDRAKSGTRAPRLAYR